MFAEPLAQARQSKPRPKTGQQAGRPAHPQAAGATWFAPQHAAAWDFSRIAVNAPARTLQKKSTRNDPRDPWEQEAERMADRVVSLAGPPQQVGGGLSPGWSAAGPSPGPPPPLPAVQGGSVQGGSGPAELPTPVRETLQDGGVSLDQPTRRFMESRFQHDFSSVRVHADARSANSAAGLQAEAYTVGSHVAFAHGLYRPESARSRRLLAHELTHVVQQGGARPLREHARSGGGAPLLVLRSAPRLARAPASSAVLTSKELDQYEAPNGVTCRVGDAAGMRLLMGIGQEGDSVTLRVFNFEAGTAEEVGVDRWAQWTMASRFAALSGGGDASALGSQLPPNELRRLWPNPVPELMRRYEAGQLALDDKAVLSTYRGMVRSDARRILNQNERALDGLLNAPGRVVRLQEYADGLREAAQVRDALVSRRDEIAHSLVVQHAPTFGLFHAGTGPDMVQNLRLNQAKGEVEQTLATWYRAFPLLTRLRTQEITAEAVQSRLLAIKENIASAREDVESGKLEPMKMDTVRAGLASKLGPKATGVVAAEDKANGRAAFAGAVALSALTFALLFIPGGVFIDAAIGLAMAASAINDAIVVGRAANTGMHVDDGLVSQEAAMGAAFGAAISSVFAIMGAAAAGFKVLRVGRALAGVSRSMPELELAERAAVARAIANDSKLVTALSGVAKDDLAISARVSAAVRRSGGDLAALRTSLTDISEIAAIPRRTAAVADAYEPLRKIVDGSDIERISRATGFSRAEVQAAKQHLMFDEQILVDNDGALYRGRFEPFESDARIWGRVARGEAVNEDEHRALSELIRHEFVEGSVLRSEQPTLENLFLHGGLEGKLRTFLQSKGMSTPQIEALLAAENKPLVPFRYAHYFAHFTTGPNPGSGAARALPLPRAMP